MSSEHLAAEPLPVELMNTVSFDGSAVRDGIRTDADVAVWLEGVEDRIQSETGVTVGEIDIVAVAEPIRRLRDALRTLAAEATEDPRPRVTAAQQTRAEAVECLNSLAHAWRELVWLDGGQTTHVVRTVGTAGDAVVGLVAQQGVELFAGSGRERLRACLAPNCLLFFFKQQTRREWCSPECGNRARVARHYQRHHATREH